MVTPPSRIRRNAEDRKHELGFGRSGKSDLGPSAQVGAEPQYLPEKHVQVAQPQPLRGAAELFELELQHRPDLFRRGFRPWLGVPLGANESPLKGRDR